LANKPRALVWLWFLAAALAVAAAVFWLVRRFPDAVAAREGRVNLTYLLALLGLLTGSLVMHRRASPGSVLRNAAIWIAIGAGLVAAYSFRHEAETLW